MIAWTANEAGAAEYQCRKDDSSLRIAVEVKKAGHTLPCEVVAEDDRGQRNVLFSAKFDREYCPARIDRTRADLEQDGWSCQQTSAVNVVGNADTADGEERPIAALQQENVPSADVPRATAVDKVVTASRQCRNGLDTRLISIVVEDASSGRPCELIYWADGDQNKLGERLWRAEHDASFCPRRLDTIVGKWAADGWQCEISDIETASLDGTPDAAIDPLVQTQPASSDQESIVGEPLTDPALEAVVTADAERIGKWMEVDPAIEIAARGDLNDDGADDAVVFLTYQSDQAAYRQYLMGYLMADDGYELASVKLLTGVSPPPAQARVDQIDKGVIWLTLPDEDESTPNQTGYRLNDQELVEVEPGSTSTEN
ncbi:MAG: hypothetical protein ACR2RE_27760 [Geminicoccaceae bacterium]